MSGIYGPLPYFRPRIWDNYIGTDTEFEGAFEQIEQFLSTEHNKNSLKEEPLHKACELARFALRQMSGLSEMAKSKLSNIITLLVTVNGNFICGVDPAMRVYLHIVKVFACSCLVERAVGKLWIFCTPANKVSSRSLESFQRAARVIPFAIKFINDLLPTDQNILADLTIFVLRSPGKFADPKHQDLFKELTTIFNEYSPPSKNKTHVEPEDHPYRIVPPPSEEDAPKAPQLTERIIREGQTIDKDIAAPPPPTLGPPASPEDNTLVWLWKSTKRTLGWSQEKTPVGLFTDIAPIVEKMSPEERRKYEEGYTHFKAEYRMVKERQISKITYIVRLNLDHYWPYLIPHGRDKYPNDKKGFLRMYDSDFANIAEELFFSTPSTPSEQEKEVLCGVLKGVQGFFEWYKRQDGLYVKGPKRPDLKVQTERMVAEAAQLRPAIHAQLIIQLKSILEMVISKESLLNGLGSHFLAVKIADLLERYLTPGALCYIFDRLLTDPMDMNTGEGKVAPFSSFDMSNHANFSLKIGGLVDKIFEEIFQLGEAVGLVSVAVGGLQAILNFAGKLGVVDYREKVGVLIQQLLASVFSSECKMIPFLLMLHLFNKKVEGNFEPTLQAFLAKTPEEKQEFVQGVQTVFTKKLYSLVMELTKKHSSVAASLVTQVGSVEDFCDTVTGRIWQITQSQELLLMLIAHLLCGVKEGLEEGMKWKRS